MLDITIQVLTASATHDTDEDAGRHLCGELVGMYTRQTQSPNASGRLGFVHINDVPIDDMTELQFLFDQNVDEDEVIVSRSLWRIDLSLMTGDEVTAIETSKELTVDWTRFKEVCKNVVTDLNLTDGDL